jgi:N-acetylmuramoyl-L-alanine amidase
MKRALTYLLFFSSTTFTQYSLEVRFVTNPERNTYVAIFQRHEITYGSAHDLAAAFNLNIRMDALYQRLEIQTDRYTVRVIASNPFVPITDASNPPTVQQLPVVPIFAASTIFVPLEWFVPILDAVTAEEIVFNRSLQLIAVGELYPRPRFDLASYSIEERHNGNLVRLPLTKRITDYESWLKPIESGGKRDEYWLYVTLVGARLDSAALQAIKPTGLIKQLLVFQSPTSAQMTFRLKGEITGTELLQGRNHELLLAIHTPTAEELALRKKREIEKNLERERSKWKMDVIVIDPGHGGKDPGTVGVTGVREKDITLNVARKLGKLIERQMKDVKVVHTRTTDEFVELYRRGQLANELGGKLFVSIHCNSMPRKPHPMSGFEIYLLRPGKTEHAIQIAERENAVVQFEEGYTERYQELTEENFIIMTLAQSAYMKYSEQFAEILQSEMETHSGLQNQGVKQAGFYVLVGASMPNVLVETGYLSNRSDERFLKSEKGQQKMAQAIFNAVKLFKQEYEKALEEGRMSETTR